MGMTYNVKAINKEGVKLFVDNIASKFTNEELEKNLEFFRYPNYEPYSLALNFEWDRYDFIYNLLESKDVNKVNDELLQKAAILFNDCYIEVFDHDGVCHAIDKLKRLIKFDDDNGPGAKLNEEIIKIYGDNRAYKYDQHSCKALIKELTKIKEVMEEPTPTDGTTNDVYWMIYAY